MEVSVVIPVYNEQDNVVPLMGKLVEVMKGMGGEWEVVVVDDGSEDKSWERVRGVAKKWRRVRGVRLRRRFGQTAALSAGFEEARGKVVVAMDGDLQNDPRDVPKLVKKLDEGFDLVSGWRRKRRDGVARRWLSVAANRIIAGVSGVEVHDFGCTLKAYRRELVSEIKLRGEAHRYVPVLAAMVGARIGEVAVAHKERKHGQSKYGLDRTLRVVLDVVFLKMMMSYQTRPLHLFGGMGLLIAGVGSLVFLWLVYLKVVLYEPLSDRPLFLVSVLLIIAGGQLVTIGVMAEMLSRVYDNASGRREYYIRERVK